MKISNRRAAENFIATERTWVSARNGSVYLMSISRTHPPYTRYKDKGYRSVRCFSIASEVYRQARIKPSVITDHEK